MGPGDEGLKGSSGIDEGRGNDTGSSVRPKPGKTIEFQTAHLGANDMIEKRKFFLVKCKREILAYVKYLEEDFNSGGEIKDPGNAKSQYNYDITLHICKQEQ